VDPSQSLRDRSSEQQPTGPDHVEPLGKTSPLSDLRGAGRLAVDLTLLVTDVVETMHHNIARRPGVLGRATLEPTKGLTGLVYRGVRGVARLVGGTVDAVLAPLVPLPSGASEWAGRAAVVGALNGVLGDHLEASRNPLAIPMHLRLGGAPLPLACGEIAKLVPQPRQRVVVMVHGLCTTDAIWNRRSHDHGQSLAQDMQADAVYLCYNSGRHISTNGAELAALLERMVDAWPVSLRELVLVGHSMGGLVIRSACAASEASGHKWLRLLQALVFLGTPHQGAPLERGGHGVDLLFSASPYTVALTRLGRVRSAGITDLRHGSVLDQDWLGRDRFARAGYLRHPQPLPRDVPAFAIAGSLSKGACARRRAPRSDGLVPVASALGQHSDPGVALSIPSSRQWIAYGTGHLDLLSSKAVYEQMRHWLAGNP
jgi:pimeloyl-ACP methyl ester carboxylesterase